MLLSFSDQLPSSSGLRNTDKVGWKTREQNFAKIDYNDDDNDGSVEFTPFVVAKHPPSYYRELCRRLGGEGKIAEAVAVVEKRMVEDRVRPEKFNYITVIHILAKAGQARKAMEFFRKIRTAGYQPGPHTITSLMNACANAPAEEAEFALQQTKWLYNREKHLFGIPKTPAIYFAAMKCFAKHGDIESVFKLADHMVKDGWYAGNRIFAYLLSAALCDKEAGFLLALQIWRTMKRLKLPIELSHYQLIVKVCRECGLGQKGNMLLEKIVQSRRQKGIAALGASQQQSNLNATQQIEATLLDVHSNREIVHVTSSNDVAVTDSVRVSNLDAIDLMATDERTIKLSLLGDLNGLLEQMKRSNVQPDLKFFSSLLYLMPRCMHQEVALVESMSALNVLPDIEFYNQLIFRRASRNDSLGALNCLDDIRRHKLTPDYRTFIALSIMCRSRSQSLTLLRDMKASNFTPNLRMFRNLLNNALYKRFDFAHVRALLSQMLKFHVKPNAALLTVLETKISEAKKIAAKSKYTKQDSPEVAILGLDEFLAFYDDWLKNVRVANSNQRDPRLKLLEKDVNVDDVREEWEKPWLNDEAIRNRQSLDDDVEIVPSSSL